jgi:hypothetical protein
MANTGFVNIQEWMTKYEKLKGTKIIIYAVIYGFSQDGQTWFHGSSGYLQKWTRTTQKTVLKQLKEMTNDGFLRKDYREFNNQMVPIYQAIVPDDESNQDPQGKKFLPPREKSSYPPGKKFLPPRKKVPTPPEKSSYHNIDNNKVYITKKQDREEGDRPCYQKYMTFWNAQIAGGNIPKLRTLTNTRKKQIKSLLKDYSEGDILEAFDKVKQSKFMNGQNDRNWTATFDWVIKPGNFVKVLEGNFDDKAQNNAKTDDLNDFHKMMYEIMEEENDQTRNDV